MGSWDLGIFVQAGRLARRPPARDPCRLPPTPVHAATLASEALLATRSGSPPASPRLVLVRGSDGRAPQLPRPRRPPALPGLPPRPGQDRSSVGDGTQHPFRRRRCGVLVPHSHRRPGWGHRGRRPRDPLPRGRPRGRGRTQPRGRAPVRRPRRPGRLRGAQRWTVSWSSARSNCAPRSDRRGPTWSTLWAWTSPGSLSWPAPTTGSAPRGRARRAGRGPVSWCARWGQRASPHPLERALGVGGNAVFALAAKVQSRRGNWTGSCRQWDVR